MAVVSWVILTKKTSQLLNSNNKYKSYIKYSSMGIQMVALIIILTFIGRYIDYKIENNIPIATIVLILFGLIAAMYYMIKTLKN
jgi:ATP synthase protein I